MASVTELKQKPQLPFFCFSSAYGHVSLYYRLKELFILCRRVAKTIVCMCECPVKPVSWSFHQYISLGVSAASEMY